jgi:Tfp pilus assembly protein PilN
MIVFQAVPPVPPGLPTVPFDPNHMPPAAIVMMVLALFTAATLVLWPLARALARRLEGRGSADTALRGEVEQLHQRLGEVDAMQARIAELEDRLDFAERLLAQSREPDRLQR